MKVLEPSLTDEELSRLENDTFKYFADEINLENGLVPDNTKQGSPSSIAAVGFALTAAGCSVAMAAHQPSRKDVGLFTHGVPRNLVVAEVGAPVTTESKGGKRVDVYSFTQGYSKAARVSRTIGHGAADVLTFGLWEVVGTPTESVFNGKRVVYEVTYDASDRIENVVALKK